MNLKEQPANAVLLILAERARQIKVEGWTPEHDNTHTMGELAKAAACYALPATVREMFPTSDGAYPANWPWSVVHWKPTPEDRVRELVKAGALIVAEIERLQRTAGNIEITALAVKLLGVNPSFGETGEILQYVQNKAK